MEGSDFVAALYGFLLDKLKLGKDFMDELDEVSITRLKDRPSQPTQPNRICSEALITFSSKEIRDIVRGAARNLAGNQSAGVRLEIPSHLQKNFQALKTVLYGLRKKYLALKRNIRYDNGAMDLVLDFCLPLCEEWMRIRPDQAVLAIPKGAANRREEVQSDKIKEIIAGSFLSPPRENDE